MKVAPKNKSPEDTQLSRYSKTVSQLNTKLKEILDRINAIYNDLSKEKKDGFSDPKIVLALSLESLASDIYVWQNQYKNRKNENILACLFLAPASYKEQMDYLYKTYVEQDVANKLSDQLKKDLSLLLKLYDGLYEKNDLDRIKSLNDAYATYIKKHK